MEFCVWMMVVMTGRRKSLAYNLFISQKDEKNSTGILDLSTEYTCTHTY